MRSLRQIITPLLREEGCKASEAACSRLSEMLQNSVSEDCERSSSYSLQRTFRIRRELKKVSRVGKNQSMTSTTLYHLHEHELKVD